MKEVGCHYYTGSSHFVLGSGKDTVFIEHEMVFILILSLEMLPSSIIFGSDALQLRLRRRMQALERCRRQFWVNPITLGSLQEVDHNILTI